MGESATKFNLAEQYDDTPCDSGGSRGSPFYWTSPTLLKARESPQFSWMLVQGIISQICCLIWLGFFGIYIYIYILVYIQYIYIHMYKYIHISIYIYIHMYINMVVYGHMILWSESYAYATQANLQYHTQPVDPKGRRTWLLPLVFPHAQVCYWKSPAFAVPAKTPVFGGWFFRISGLKCWYFHHSDCCLKNMKNHIPICLKVTSPFSWQLHPS